MPNQKKKEKTTRHFQTYCSEADVQWMINFRDPALYEEHKDGSLALTQEATTLEELIRIVEGIHQMSGDYLIDGALDEATKDQMVDHIRKEMTE